MSLYLSSELMDLIHAHGELAYPEEGAGLLLGTIHGENKHVFELLEFNNAREDGARRNRYLLTASDYRIGEREAARIGLDIVGVFHSHPDHPDHPSEFDREWAMPWLSYVITSVGQGSALSSRSWQLSEDRSQFIEEKILVTDQSKT